MKYWAFFASSRSDGAILSCVPDDGPKSYKYKKVIPLKDNFPALDDAVMYFDPNYPDRMKLYDVMDCLDNVVVVSGRAKAIFEQEGIVEEFLPVQILDHKDKVVSKDYFIFNNQIKIDFIDMEKSDLAMDPTFVDEVSNIDCLVVREDIKQTPKLLCPVNMTTQLFISDEFKLVLENAGIEGFKAFPADGWDGLDV